MSGNYSYIWWILIGIAVLGVVLYIRHRSKALKMGNVMLITGGVKTGKTTLAVHLSIKQYRRALRGYYIKCAINYLRLKKNRRVYEKPLLYSNIPLAMVDYVPLNNDLLLRQKRFAYGSVVLISEAALVADTQNFRDEFTNQTLTFFNKLFGHETKGGYLIYDTQNIADVHYSIRRACSSYLWIHSSNKAIPFFIKYDVRELAYDDSNSVVNVYNEDVEDTTKMLWVYKGVWKKFDSYCYSILTDKLEVYKKIMRRTRYDSLKTDFVLQVKESQYLQGGSKNGKEEDKKDTK